VAVFEPEAEGIVLDAEETGGDIDDCRKRTSAKNGSMAA